MSILAKLHFCSEERDLLHTNLDYHRLTRSNGKPSTWVMGGYLTVTFQSEMYDDSFIETMIADRSDNKSVEYPYNLYVLRDGKIVFYKDEMIEGQEFFVYSFKDAVIISYHETFDNQTGMYVTLTISPAIQDYRFFGNMKWEEKSPTRFIKTWEENYIPPVKETTYKAVENNEIKIIESYITNEQGEEIEHYFEGDTIYLYFKTRNAIGKNVDINLNNKTYDFRYDGEVLKNDTLKNFKVNNVLEKIKLEVVENEKEPKSKPEKEA